MFYSLSVLKWFFKLGFCVCILVFSVKHFKWWSCDLVLSRNVSSLLNNDCCYCCCFVSLYITILSSWAIQISTNYSKCKIKLQGLMKEWSCSVILHSDHVTLQFNWDVFLPHCYFASQQDHDCEHHLCETQTCDLWCQTLN